MSDSAEYTSAVLVFPHQLFAEHPALKKGRRVWLTEDSLLFGDARYPARFHRQKLVFHRASMKAYARVLRDAGHEVDYKDYQPDQSVAALVQKVHEGGCTTIHVVDPTDDMLERRLERAAKRCGVGLVYHETPSFLLSRSEGDERVGTQNAPYRMGSFYRAQRTRFNILLQNDKPVGGAWSFDKENRKKWPRKRVAPTVPSAEPASEVAEAVHYVRKRFPDNPGQIEPFAYPVTHQGAEQWLAAFLQERLEGFGTYEDAIVAHEPVLHHSLLSPLLNAGLLTPRYVLDQLLDYAKVYSIPLNDLEGFVRQLIGWREFMWCMYRRIGVQQRTGNFWNHRRALPQAFYEGTTGVEPVDVVIHRVRQHAYSHHIERLMVVGNFMLLCEIDPDHVYRWFMEMYIDAYDWVMVPNVYGMSQFADGGLLCTKPYISGSNYIRKMGNFASGPWCAIWDALFWCFIHKNRAFFSSQPRLSMMARQLDRMKPSTLDRHRATANDYLAQWA